MMTAMDSKNLPLDEHEDPFIIEIVSKYPMVQKIVSERVSVALDDPSLDAEIERIVQEANGNDTESSNETIQPVV